MWSWWTGGIGPVASARWPLERRLRVLPAAHALGEVLHLGTKRITLEKGTIPTDAGQVHVDCTAAGLALRPARPIFEDGRITLQQVRQSQPSINAAVLGHIEATRDGNEEKNRLSPVNPYHDTAHDWSPGCDEACTWRRSGPATPTWEPGWIAHGSTSPAGWETTAPPIRVCDRL